MKDESKAGLILPKLKITCPACNAQFSQEPINAVDAKANTASHKQITININRKRTREKI